MLDVTVDGPELLDGLTRAFSVTSSAVASPVFHNVQAQTLDNNRLLLVGSDGAISYLTDLSADVKQHGNVLLPPQVLQLVRLAPQGVDIRITADETDLVIRALTRTGEPSWRLGAEQGVIEFPKPGLQGSTCMAVDRKRFSAALAAVLPALHGLHVSAQLQYIQLKSDPQCLRAYGGSQYRCVYDDFGLSDVDVLISGRAAAELIKMCSRSSEETIGIQDDGDHLIFVVGDLLIARKNTQIYPDLDKYVLEERADDLSALEVDRKALLSTLQRVKPFAGSLNYVELDVRDDVMKLTTVDQWNQEARDRIDVAWFDTSRRVGCDLAQLASMLSAVPLSESMEICFGPKTTDRPGLIYFDAPGFTGHMEQLRSDLLRSTSKKLPRGESVSASI